MAPDDSDDNDAPVYDEEQPTGTSMEKSHGGNTATPCHLCRTAGSFSSGAKRKIKTKEDVAEEESLNAKLTGLSARQRNQCVVAKVIGVLEPLSARPSS